MVVHYIGLFILVLGIALLIEKRRRKKGIQTWEAKHNINIPKPLVVVMIIVGVILLFGTNFHSKISYTDQNGKEHVVTEHGADNDSEKGNDFATSERDTSDEEELSITDEQATESDSNTTNTDNDTEELPDRDASISKPNSLTVGAGTVIIPDIPNTIRGDEYYVSIVSFHNDEFSAYYRDSFIEVGDDNGVNDWINIHTENKDDYDVTSNTTSINGKTCFIIFKHFKDSEINDLYMLQDVGENNYVEIYADSYTGMNGSEMVDMVQL